MCKSKMKKTFRKPIFKRRKPPKQKKLPSASEIELNRVNAKFLQTMIMILYLMPQNFNWEINFKSLDYC